MLHMEERRIECTCEACWALRSGDPEYRPVGTRVEWLPELEMSGERWAGFNIPIGLAFFMRSSAAGGVVAMYPSPAGATESRARPRVVWAALVADNPELERLESDAEGLVVNRLAEPPQYADRADRRVLQARRPGEGQLGGDLRRRPAGGGDRGLLRGAAREGGGAVSEGASATSTAPRPRAPGPAPAFEILGAEAVRHAAAPTLRFAVQVTEPTGREVYTIALRAQIMIEPAKRSYDDETKARLVELFGEPERWGDHHRGRRCWRRSTCSCRRSPAPPPSRSRCRASFDLELAAAKYLYSLPDGNVPLTFNFTGTIFYRARRRADADRADPLGLLAPASRCRSSTWREMIRDHYPKGGWVALETDTLDALARAQGRAGAAVVRRHRGRRCCEDGRGERRVDELVDSLLYEGYALYPYTPGRGQERHAHAVRHRLPAGLRRDAAHGVRPPAHGLRAGAATESRS